MGLDLRECKEDPMTRKRFIKQLMARGWSKYRAQALINALQEFAGYDYAKLLQWYDRECKKAWERNCVTMTFTLSYSFNDAYGE